MGMPSSKRASLFQLGSSGPLPHFARERTVTPKMVRSGWWLVRLATRHILRHPKYGPATLVRSGARDRQQRLFVGDD
jgi:hypothetical protein